MTLPEGVKAELASGRLKPSPAGWYVGRIGAVPDVRPATTLFVNFPPAQSLRAVTLLRATNFLHVANGAADCGDDPFDWDNLDFVLWLPNNPTAPRSSSCSSRRGGYCRMRNEFE